MIALKENLIEYTEKGDLDFIKNTFENLSSFDLVVSVPKGEMIHRNMHRKYILSYLLSKCDKSDLEFCSYHACYCNDSDMLELLVSKGATNLMMGIYGACEGFQPDMIELLLKKYKQNRRLVSSIIDEYPNYRLFELCKKQMLKRSKLHESLIDFIFEKINKTALVL